MELTLFICISPHTIKPVIASPEWVVAISFHQAEIASSPFGVLAMTSIEFKVEHF